MSALLGYVGELCVPVEHESTAQTNFVIFTAYIDEADTHGAEPTMIMAAYLGHAYQWRRFEVKLRRIQAKFDFQVFHAKDFKAKAREFSGWSDDRCSQLIGELSQLVEQNLTEGLAVFLEHSRYMNEYRASPVPKKMRLDSQYGVCFRACLGRILYTLERRGNRDKINVVIERGHRNVGDCERIFNDAKSIWRQSGSDIWKERYRPSLNGRRHAGSRLFHNARTASGGRSGDSQFDFASPSKRRSRLYRARPRGFGGFED